MAIVDIKNVVDDERNFIAHVHIHGDGASGDLTDQVLIDISTLSGSHNDLRPVRVSGEFTGFDVELKFGGTTPRTFAVLTGNGGAFNHRWHRFGGLVNNAIGPDGTITISTYRVTSISDLGFFVLECRKVG